MQNGVPMDRLVCGDVGYGKTEVALRATLMAVLGGKQVAVLAPTTVLAEQHFVTFSERFADFPVRVAVLSRFRTKAEQQETLAALAEGKLDVVVGTHRLLSRDVRFNDLGLVVVDEEQRFGVTHKERLKELRTQVDVLTLTATPIPRTLQMAMGGLREISIIATPPADRLAIRTFVAASTASCSARRSGASWRAAASSSTSTTASKTWPRRPRSCARSRRRGRASPSGTARWPTASSRR